MHAKVVLIPHQGNSLAVQCVGLCALTAEGMGLIPGWGTKISQASQHGQKKIPHQLRHKVRSSVILNYKSYVLEFCKSCQI